MGLGSAARYTSIRATKITPNANNVDEDKKIKAIVKSDVLGRSKWGYGIKRLFDI